MTNPQAEHEFEPDLEIVRKDGSSVVVEVKQYGGRRIKYAVPRSTLDVVFTEKGIVYASPALPLAPAREDDPTPATPKPPMLDRVRQKTGYGKLGKRRKGGAGRVVVTRKGVEKT